MWVADVAELIEATPSDIAAATAILRRLDLNIRTADALNIAIAMRLDAALATFDEKMADNARALGAAVAAA
jgi:predicted nucleic acid-binding protein